MTLARKLDALVKERSQNNSGLYKYSNKEVETDIRLQQRFHKLRGVSKLQKSIVRQNMHNAMSPLSAISGYLELINMSLGSEESAEKIGYYKEQIEHGIHEVNSILEQLHGLYTDETDTTDQEEDVSLDVDINWLVNEVLRTVNMHAESYETELTDYPLYVSVDLFIAKLIVFELVNYARKCSMKSDSLKLMTHQQGKFVNFTIQFNTTEQKKSEIASLIADIKNEDTEISNSFNEGLISSKELAIQLNGTLSFLSVQDGEARLTLTLPISF